MDRPDGVDDDHYLLQRRRVSYIIQVFQATVDLIVPKVEEVVLAACPAS